MKPNKPNNAIQHGLLRKKTHLMADESRYLFNKLNRTLYEYWRPTNLAEKLLVEQLAFNYWRLKRAFKLETELLQVAKIDAERLTDSFDRMGSKRKVHTIEHLNFENLDRFRRYISSIQRQILRILHELERIEATRNGRNVPPPVAVDLNIDSSND